MFMLYRKGDSTLVPTPTGPVRCDIVRVEEKDIEDFKKEGWTNDIEDIRPKKAVSKEAEKPKTAKQLREEKVLAAQEEQENINSESSHEVIDTPVEPNGKDENKDTVGN